MTSARPTPSPNSSSRLADAELFGWWPIKSHAGSEIGAQYRAHHLDVVEVDHKWQWSAVHVRQCGPNAHGACGTERSRVSAQRAAIAAVDHFACAASRVLPGRVVAA